MKPRIPRHFRNLCIPEMQIDLRSVCNLMSRVKENVPPADSRPVNASNVQKSVNGSQRRSVAGARAELRYHAKKTAMLGHYCFEPGPAMNPHMLCDELQCDFTLRNECTSMVSFCACHPSCSGHEYHVDSYEHCCKCFVSFDFPFEPPLYLPFDLTRSISIGTGPSVELPAVSDPQNHLLRPPRS